MSSLQRQLAALAAQTGSRAALGGQRGAAPGAAAGGTLKASLIFDAAEAADMDAADVHAVAVNGLEVRTLPRMRALWAGTLCGGARPPPRG